LETSIEFGLFKNRELSVTEDISKKVTVHNSTGSIPLMALVQIQLISSLI